jgi:hypothetical protein
MDAGHQRLEMAAAMGRTDTRALEIVRRYDTHRVVVLPRRRNVERTTARSAEIGAG